MLYNFPIVALNGSGREQPRKESFSGVAEKNNLFLPKRAVYQKESTVHLNLLLQTEIIWKASCNSQQTSLNHPQNEVRSLACRNEWGVHGPVIHQPELVSFGRHHKEGMQLVFCISEMRSLKWKAPLENKPSLVGVYV